MIITVQVVPRASKNELIRLADGAYKARLTAAPVDGGANEALIRLLAKELRVSKSAVSILSGLKSRKKKVEIS